MVTFVEPQWPQLFFLHFLSILFNPSIEIIRFTGNGNLHFDSPTISRNLIVFSTITIDWGEMTQ